MAEQTYKSANRRYRAWFIPMMVLYCVLCFGGAALLGLNGWQQHWMRGVIAILTIAPIFIVFWLLWRYTQETDEYTRLRQLQALAIGGMVTASAAWLIGFLQLYKVVTQVPVFMLLPLFFLSYGQANWLRCDKACI